MRKLNVAYVIGYLVLSLYMCFVTYLFSQPGMHMPVHLIVTVWVLTGISFGTVGFYWSRLWNQLFPDVS